jgi:hypothetical protein
VLIWTGHRQLETADPDGYRAILEVLDAASDANPQRPLSVLLEDA